MNKGYEITARVPSIMIAGGSNFPVRKKEKQNAAADKNMEEYREIQGLLDKIRSTGMGGISADDPNAVSKLESKLAKLEALQETMKAVNAYYRKHKTLDGCPHLSPEQIEKMKASMSGSWRGNPKPFESYELSNNNAEIHRLKDRITALTRRKELGYVGWEFDGGRVEANTADNRLQIFFDEKPDKEIREELKGNGFRYAPSAEAWQRQLNDNAIYAADRIKCIQPLNGESPTELQKRARREAAAQKEAVPEQPQEETQARSRGTPSRRKPFTRCGRTRTVTARKTATFCRSMSRRITAWQSWGYSLHGNPGKVPGAFGEAGNRGTDTGRRKRALCKGTGSTARRRAGTGNAGADRHRERAGQRHLFHLPVKGRGRYAGLSF